jgi:tetratricopeptide (TPR) repeat protein
MASQDYEKFVSRFESLYNQAVEEYSGDNPEGAEATLLKARQLLLQAGEKNPFFIAMIQNLMSAICADRGELDKAAKLSQTAFEAMLNLEEADTDNIIGLGNNTLSFYAQLGDLDSFRQVAQALRSFCLDTVKRAELAAHSHLMEASILKDQGADTPMIQKPLREAIALAQKDSQGDLLTDVLGKSAMLLNDMGEVSDAIQILTNGLASLHELYSVPLKPEETADPAWVLDQMKARSLVFREGYQNEGIDPSTMSELRRLLADFLMQHGQYEDALVEYERLVQQSELEETQAQGLSESDDEYEEEDEEDEELWEDEEEQEDDDDDEELEFEEDDEEIDDEDREMARAALLLSYAISLQKVGEAQKNKEHLLKAKTLSGELDDLVASGIDPDEETGLAESVASLKSSIEKSLSAF